MQLRAWRNCIIRWETPSKGHLVCAVRRTLIEARVRSWCLFDGGADMLLCNVYPKWASIRRSQPTVRATTMTIHEQHE